MANGIKIRLSNDKCHFYSISYDIDNVLLDKTLFGVPEAVSQQAMTASLHPGFEESGSVLLSRTPFLRQILASLSQRRRKRAENEKAAAGFSPVSWNAAESPSF